MICSICRRAIPDDSKFCQFCGATVTLPATPPGAAGGSGVVKLSKNMLRDPSGEISLERTAVKLRPAPARRRVLPGAAVQPRWPPIGVDMLPAKKRRKKGGS